VASSIDFNPARPLPIPDGQNNVPRAGSNDERSYGLCAVEVQYRLLTSIPALTQQHLAFFLAVTIDRSGRTMLAATSRRRLIRNANNESYDGRLGNVDRHAPQRPSRIHAGEAATAIRRDEFRIGHASLSHLCHHSGNGVLRFRRNGNVARPREIVHIVMAE